MRIMLLFISALLLIFKSYGQSLAPAVVSTSGNSNQGQNISLEWVIGADKVATGLIVTEIPLQSPRMEIAVFPNPTTQFVSLEVKQKGVQNLFLKVFDVQGKEILSRKISANPDKIDFGKYGNGIYFLKVLNPEGEFVSTFKIEKSN